MTPFPSPPATAIAEAIEKAKIAEWIDELEALDVDSGSPRKIQLVPYRYPDRPEPTTDDAPLISALLPWASEMAGLFRTFPLTRFNVVIRSLDRPLRNWTAPRPRADASLCSDKFWDAQRALETAVVHALVQKHGETGFEEASLLIHTDEHPPSFSVRSDLNEAFRPSQTPDAVRDWRRAMNVWLDGIDAIIFGIANCPLSAHERLDLMRRSASTSSGRVA